MRRVIARTQFANATTHPVVARPVIAAALVGLGITGCAHYTPKPLVPEQTGVTLESRTLSDPGLRVFIEESLGHTLSDWPLQTWNLDLLTLVAFYYSPELDVSRAHWSAADAAVVTAGMRPNPSLNIAPEFSTNSPSGVSPWLPAISLDVPIETAGKRGHRMQEAQHLSESARWSVVTTAWGVRSKLTGALLDYTAARHREALLKRQLDLQAEIVQLEEGELAAGAVAGSDVTVGRIQLARTRLDLEATRAQAAETRARSADALGIPLRALDGADLMFLFDSTDASTLTSEEARRRALRSRSDVLGALAEYEATQAALQLEVAKQYPDIHLGPGYQWDQGQDKWLIGLTFELPVFNRNQGPIAEAAARRTEVAARFMALQVQIIHQIDTATSALKAADESSQSGENLLAAQRQNLEAVERQLKAGAVGALEVASAQIDAANAEGLAFEASVRRQQAVRALEDAVQRPLGSEADARGAVLQIESTQRSPR
jgi:cobalt-zinc-cadmium efflux system outer membrane protein